MCSLISCGFFMSRIFPDGRPSRWFLYIIASLPPRGIPESLSLSNNVFFSFTASICAWCKIVRVSAHPCSFLDFVYEAYFLTSFPLSLSLSPSLPLSLSLRRSTPLFLIYLVSRILPYPLSLLLSLSRSLSASLSLFWVHRARKEWLCTSFSL